MHLLRMVASENRLHLVFQAKMVEKAQFYSLKP